MKRILARIVSIVSAMAVCVSVMPSVFAEGAIEVSTSGGLYDAIDTATGDTVDIVLTADVDMTNYISIPEGLTVNIDCGEYSINDLYVSGEGALNVTGNIGSTGGDALNIGGSLTVYVEGDVTSEVADGVEISGSSTVSVKGNVTGGNDAIEAYNDGSDVMTITVEGDVIGVGAGAYGIYLEGNIDASVTGDIYGGDGYLEESRLSDPEDYSDGGTAALLYEGASLKVDGDIYGGDSMGTYGYGGYGADIGVGCTLEVNGNVTGGTVTGDPDVAPVDGSNGQPGAGILTYNGSDITVYGDVSAGAEPNIKDAWTIPGIFVLVRSIQIADTEPGSIYIDGTVTGIDGYMQEIEGFTHGYAIEIVKNNGPQQEITADMIPEITVWKLVNGKEDLEDFVGVVYDDDSQEFVDIINSEKLSYIVRTEENENATIEPSAEAAFADTEVDITVTAAEGYQVDAVANGETELEGEDGAYTLVVPAGGGIVVSATVSEVPADEPTDEPTDEPVDEPTDDNVQTGAEAGLALAAITLAGAAVVATKKQK